MLRFEEDEEKFEGFLANDDDDDDTMLFLIRGGDG